MSAYFSHQSFQGTQSLPELLPGGGSPLLRQAPDKFRESAERRLHRGEHPAFAGHVCTTMAEISWRRELTGLCARRAAFARTLDIHGLREQCNQAGIPSRGQAPVLLERVAAHHGVKALAEVRRWAQNTSVLQKSLLANHYSCIRALCSRKWPDQANPGRSRGRRRRGAASAPPNSRSAMRRRTPVRFGTGDEPATCKPIWSRGQGAHAALPPARLYRFDNHAPA